LVEPWLKAQKVVKPRALNSPRLIGAQGNPGLA
jgi:hypothetical protein